MEKKEGEEIMLGAQEQREEVVQVISKITAERAAMEQDLMGQGAGSDHNGVIIATMERISQFHHRLGVLVGDTLALAMISQWRQISLEDAEQKGEKSIDFPHLDQR